VKKGKRGDAGEDAILVDFTGENEVHPPGSKIAMRPEVRYARRIQQRSVTARESQGQA